MARGEELGPFVDCRLEHLDRHVDAVGALQHHELDIGPDLPLVEERREVQVGRDDLGARGPIDALRDHGQCRRG